MASNGHKQKMEWYSALAAENCVLVKALLTDTDGSHLMEGWTEDAQASVRFNLRRGWKGRTALHVAVRRGDVQLTKTILEMITNQATDEAGTQTDDGALAVHGLLAAKDGDYELDALAMAVINGNHEIVTLLRDASLECPSNPYDIRDNTWLTRDDEESDAAPSPARSVDSGAEAAPDHSSASMATTAAHKISTITDKAFSGIESEYPPDKIEAMKELYAEDCDFNFLEMGLYFFHFSFSTWKFTKHRKRIIQSIQKNIVREARKEKVLEYLLEELFDGQGRTVLHVAVDSEKVKEFLEVVAQGVDKDVKLRVEESHKAVAVGSKEADEIPVAPADVNLNVADSAGRTPLYRAAAKDHSRAVEALTRQPTTNVVAKIKFAAHQWGEGLDIDKLSRRNGFKSDCVFITEDKLQRKAFNNQSNSQGGPGPNIEHLEEVCSTALHIAIIHKNDLQIVKQLLHYPPGFTPSNRRHRFPSDIDCYRRLTWPVGKSLRDDGNSKSYSIQTGASTMHLAVLVGSLPILQPLLEEHEEKKGYDSGSVEKTFSSFLLAAALGNPDTVKAFLDSRCGEFDPDLVADTYNNSALHHALRGKNIIFHPHLVDFVGCHHVFRWRWENQNWISHWLADPLEDDLRKDAENESAEVPTEKSNRAELQARYGQRCGSVNLLLQAGIDLWRKNTQEKVACPGPEAPEEFVQWWYQRAAEETQREQETLNAAANAISVTAALVLTAAYEGPFGPPLGYSGDTSKVQVDILAVRIFVVCNNMAFYLALAAIMYALLPSLPLLKESMFKELARTRVLVGIAMALLFPSIICVLMSFAASYIAVSPERGRVHHGLTIITTVVGGVVCFFVILRFGYRLLNVLKTLPMEVARANSEVFFLEAALLGVPYIYQATARFFRARSLRGRRKSG